MELRDYQKEALAAIWSDLFKHRSALCVLPTGSGKSLIIAELLKLSFAKKDDLRAMVLFNNIDLLSQIYERFVRLMPEISISLYSKTLNSRSLSRLTLASVQSLVSNKRIIDAGVINLVVLDEVHNVNDQDRDSRYIKFIEEHYKKNDKLKIVGFTATPYRATGVIYGENKLFTHITYQKTINEMIRKGYLVKPTMKSPEHKFDISNLRVVAGDFSKGDLEKLTADEKKVDDQVRDALSRLVGRNCVVWFCTSIFHAETVLSRLETYGETATILHSKLEKNERKRNKQKFVSGAARHLVFINIVREGFDHPPIDAIVMMRPTRSPVLYCLVLDYGRVVETLGTIQNPLVVEKYSRKYKPQKRVNYTICPKCLTYNNLLARACEECGYSLHELRLKNLTRSASSNTQDLTSSVSQHKVTAVCFTRHMSKNGNKCLVINYHTNELWRLGYMDADIKEYFVLSKPFSYQKMMHRLSELRVKYDESIYDKTLFSVEAVKTRRDGKYIRVVGVIIKNQKERKRWIG